MFMFPRVTYKSLRGEMHRFHSLRYTHNLVEGHKRYKRETAHSYRDRQNHTHTNVVGLRPTEVYLINSLEIMPRNATQ